MLVRRAFAPDCKIYMNLSGGPVRSVPSSAGGVFASKVHRTTVGKKRAVACAFAFPLCVCDSRSVCARIGGNTKQLHTCGGQASSSHAGLSTLSEKAAASTVELERRRSAHSKTCLFFLRVVHVLTSLYLERECLLFETSLTACR